MLITDAVTFKAGSFAACVFLRGEGNESCTTSCSPLIIAALVGRLHKQHRISRTKEEKKKEWPRSLKPPKKVALRKKKQQKPKKKLGSLIIKKT